MSFFTENQDRCFCQEVVATFCDTIHDLTKRTSQLITTATPTDIQPAFLSQLAQLAIGSNINTNTLRDNLLENNTRSFIP